MYPYSNQYGAPSGVPPGAAQPRISGAPQPGYIQYDAYGSAQGTYSTAAYMDVAQLNPSYTQQTYSAYATLPAEPQQSSSASFTTEAASSHSPYVAYPVATEAVTSYRKTREMISREFENLLQTRDWKALYGRAPTLKQYEEYQERIEATNWAALCGRTPQFEDYLSFHKQLASYDWVKICKHIPTFTDYMDFLFKIETDRDWERVDLKPQFRDYISYYVVGEQGKKWSHLLPRTVLFIDFLRYSQKRDSRNWNDCCPTVGTPLFQDYLGYAAFIEARDMEAMFGRIPTFMEYMEFHELKSKSSWKRQCAIVPTFDHYLEFKEHYRSRDWLHFCGEIPSFKDYINYLNHENSTNWKKLQNAYDDKPYFTDYMKFNQICASRKWNGPGETQPTFDLFIEYLIYRASRDWKAITGRVPNFLDFVDYLTMVEANDCNVTDSRIPSFKDFMMTRVLHDPVTTPASDKQKLLASHRELKLSNIKAALPKENPDDFTRTWLAQSNLEKFASGATSQSPTTSSTSYSMEKSSQKRRALSPVTGIETDPIVIPRFGVDIESRQAELKRLSPPSSSPESQYYGVPRKTKRSMDRYESELRGDDNVCDRRPSSPRHFEEHAEIRRISHGPSRADRLRYHSPGSSPTECNQRSYPSRSELDRERFGSHGREAWMSDERRASKDKFHSTERQRFHSRDRALQFEQRGDSYPERRRSRDVMPGSGDRYPSPLRRSQHSREGRRERSYCSAEREPSVRKKSPLPAFVPANNSFDEFYNRPISSEKSWSAAESYRRQSSPYLGRDRNTSSLRRPSTRYRSPPEVSSSRVSRSPMRRSPFKRSRSPVRRARYRHSKSPLRRSRSPFRHSRSPFRRSRSPFRRSKSPLRRSALRYSRSPARRSSIRRLSPVVRQRARSRSKSPLMVSLTFDKDTMRTNRRIRPMYRSRSRSRNRRERHKSKSSRPATDEHTDVTDFTDSGDERSESAGVSKKKLMKEISHLPASRYDILDKRNKDLLFNCPVDYLQFQGLSEFRGHARSAHGLTLSRFRCFRCSFDTDLVDMLSDHLKYKHKIKVASKLVWDVLATTRSASVREGAFRNCLKHQLKFEKWERTKTPESVSSKEELTDSDDENSKLEAVSRKKLLNVIQSLPKRDETKFDILDKRREQRVFKCPIDDSLPITGLAAFSKHVQNCHAVLLFRYRCYRCSFETEICDMMSDHLKYKHKLRVESHLVQDVLVKTQLKNTEFRDCEITDKSDKIKHTVTSTDKKSTLKCHICDKTAKDESDLRSHFAKSHLSEGIAHLSGSDQASTSIALTVDEQDVGKISTSMVKIQETVEPVFTATDSQNFSPGQISQEKRAFTDRYNQYGSGAKQSYTSPVRVHRPMPSIEAQTPKTGGAGVELTCELCKPEIRTFIGIDRLTKHVLEMHRKPTPVDSDLRFKGDVDLRFKADFDLRQKLSSKPTRPKKVPPQPCLPRSDEEIVNLMKENNITGFDVLAASEKPVACVLCGSSSKIVFKITKLRDHIWNEHMRSCTIFRCVICGLDYPVGAAMSHHVRFKHNISLTEEQVNQLLAVTDQSKLLRSESDETNTVTDIDIPAVRKGLLEFLKSGPIQTYDILKTSSQTKKMYICALDPCNNTNVTVAMTNLRNARKHAFVVHKMSLTVFRCFYCGQDFDVAGALSRHLTSEHGETLPLSIVSSLLMVTDTDKITVGPSKSANEMQASLTFTFKEALLKVTKLTKYADKYDVFNTPKDLLFLCDLCDGQKVTNGLEEFKKHIKTDHGSRDLIKYSDFICFNCGEACQVAAQLCTHMEASHGVSISGDLCFKYLVVTNLGRIKAAANIASNSNQDSVKNESETTTNKSKSDSVSASNISSKIEDISGQVVTEEQMPEVLKNSSIVEYDIIKTENKECTQTVATCYLCSGTEFQDLVKYREHMREDHKKNCAVYRCFECKLQYPVAGAMAHHLFFKHKRIVAVELVEKYLIVTNIVKNCTSNTGASSTDKSTDTTSTINSTDVTKTPLTDDDIMEYLENSQHPEYDILRVEAEDISCSLCKNAIKFKYLVEFKVHLHNKHGKSWTAYRCFCCQLEYSIVEAMAHHLQFKHHKCLTNEQVKKFLQVTDINKETKLSKIEPNVIEISDSDANTSLTEEEVDPSTQWGFKYVVKEERGKGENSQPVCDEEIMECLNNLERQDYDILYLQKEENKRIMCKLCKDEDEDFDLTEFKDHLQGEHNKNWTVYRCIYCLLEYPVPEAMARHLTFKHKKFISIDQVLNFFPVTNIEKEANRSEMEPEGAQVDPRVSMDQKKRYEMVSNKNLMKYVQKSESKDYDVLYLEFVENLRRPCGVCEGTVEYNLIEFRYHLKDVHNIGWTIYKCCFCLVEFQSVKTMQKHLKIDHQKLISTPQVHKYLSVTNTEKATSLQQKSTDPGGDIIGPDDPNVLNLEGTSSGAVSDPNLAKSRKMEPESAQVDPEGMSMSEKKSYDSVSDEYIRECVQKSESKDYDILYLEVAENLRRPCSICKGTIEYNLIEFREHLKKIHNIGWTIYKCCFCHVEFESGETVRQHLKMEHKKIVSSDQVAKYLSVTNTEKATSLHQKTSKQTSCGALMIVPDDPNLSKVEGTIFGVVSDKYVMNCLRESGNKYSILYPERALHGKRSRPVFKCCFCPEENSVVKLIAQHLRIQHNKLFHRRQVIQFLPIITIGTHATVNQQTIVTPTTTNDEKSVTVIDEAVSDDETAITDDETVSDDAALMTAFDEKVADDERPITVSDEIVNDVENIIIIRDEVVVDDEKLITISDEEAIAICNDMIRIGEKEAPSGGTTITDNEALEHVRKSDNTSYDVLTLNTEGQKACGLCKAKVELNFVEFKEHLEKVHKRNLSMYQCCFCKLDYILPASLMRHVKSKHNQLFSTEQVKKFLSITNIEKASTRSLELKQAQKNIEMASHNSFNLEKAQNKSGSIRTTSKETVEVIGSKNIEINAPKPVIGTEEKTRSLPTKLSETNVEVIQQLEEASDEVSSDQSCTVQSSSARSSAKRKITEEKEIVPVKFAKLSNDNVVDNQTAVSAQCDNLPPSKSEDTNNKQMIETETAEKCSEFLPSDTCAEQSGDAGNEKQREEPQEIKCETKTQDKQVEQTPADNKDESETDFGTQDASTKQALASTSKPEVGQTARANFESEMHLVSVKADNTLIADSNVVSVNASSSSETDNSLSKTGLDITAKPEHARSEIDQRQSVDKESSNTKSDCLKSDTDLNIAVLLTSTNREQSKAEDDVTGSTSKVVGESTKTLTSRTTHKGVQSKRKLDDSATAVAPHESVTDTTDVPKRIKTSTH